MSLTIDDKTKISLWGVICALPFLVGAIVWLSAIDNRSNAAADEVRSLRELVVDIRDRIIRIEEHQKQTERRK